jgi:uncharacterized repeat protein (TIGR03943 family)
MKRTRAPALIAASPPVLFAALIARLWLAGTLGYYVNAQTVWIVLGGGVLFLLVGVAALWRALRSDHAGRFSWRTLVFLAPLAAGLALPAHPLSASSGQSSSLGSLQLTTHIAAGGSGDTFGYWTSMLGSHPDASWWAGRRVTLVGFVAHQSGLPARSFIAGRYLVTCCVVDATLMGFPVQLAGGRQPAEGAWVQVQGVFGRQFWTDPSGQQYPLVQHARIEPVSVPSNPYLSP